MIDGVHFAEVCCVVCMVILTDGTKVPVGLREGDTENATLVRELLADLVARGLSAEGGLLVVIDGGKALAAGVKSVFGDLALVGRCQLHKRRNVLDYLPKKDRGWVETRMVRAFNHADPDQGLADARRLATELERKWPDAAGSLREGLEEMFTVSRLGIDGRLAKTLTNTNAIESMISIARTVTARVKRWQDGDMRRRWCASGMLEAERSFRRVKAASRCPNSSPRSAATPKLSQPASTITKPTPHEPRDRHPRRLQQAPDKKMVSLPPGVLRVGPMLHVAKQQRCRHRNQRGGQQVGGCHGQAHGEGQRNEQ